MIATERTHIHNAEASLFRKSLCVISSKMCYIRYARLQTVTSPEHIYVPRSCTKLHAVTLAATPGKRCHFVIPIFLTLSMILIPIILLRAELRVQQGGVHLEQ